MEKPLEFKDVVAISGMGGLYQMLHQRPDGVIVKPLGGDKSQYVSNRIHTFSPLDKITIYTQNDSTPILDVLCVMLEDEHEKNGLLPGNKAPSSNFKTYFERILPDYDKERVYVSDIKKLLKWYAILKDFDLIKKGEEPIEEVVSEVSEESGDTPDPVVSPEAESGENNE